MSVQGILNIVRRECERLLSTQGKPRLGIVDSYDPALYCAKVRLQPENVLTGFLPITAEFVGNGWGLLFGPTVGDVVEVNYQEGGKNAGYIGKRFYSSVTVPPGPVPSGEGWLIHKSGSFLKFTNDGRISVNSASDMNFESGGDMNITTAGKFNVNAGTEAVLHAANTAIVDAGGTGVKYQPALVSTFTDGVSSTHSGPTPPAVT